MYHKIILTGNSLAVTIPSKVVRSLGLRRGQQVSVSINLQKATLIFICVLVLMPSQIKIGSTILYRPAANFSVLNLSIQRDLEFHLGLDLQGGTHLVYEADTSKVD